MRLEVAGLAAGGLRYHGDAPLVCALVRSGLVEARDDAYLSGSLEDPEFSEADMDAALARLPDAPAIAF